MHKRQQELHKYKQNSTRSIIYEHVVKVPQRSELSPLNLHQNQQQQGQQIQNKCYPNVQGFTSILESPKEQLQPNITQNSKILKLEQLLRSLKRKNGRLQKIISKKMQKERQLKIAYQQIAKKKVQQIIGDIPQQYKLNQQQLRKNIEEISIELRLKDEQLIKQRQQKQFYKNKYQDLNEKIKRFENIKQLNKLYQHQIQTLNKKVLELSYQVQHLKTDDARNKERIFLLQNKIQPLRSQNEQIILKNLQQELQINQKAQKVDNEIQKSSQMKKISFKKAETYKSNQIQVEATQKIIRQKNIQKKMKKQDGIDKYIDKNKEELLNRTQKSFDDNCQIKQIQVNNLSQILHRNQPNYSIQQLNNEFLLKNSNQQSSQEFRFYQQENPQQEKDEQMFFSAYREDQIKEGFGNCESFSKLNPRSVDNSHKQQEFKGFIGRQQNILLDLQDKQQKQDEDFYSIMQQNASIRYPIFSQLKKSKSSIIPILKHSASSIFEQPKIISKHNNMDIDKMIQEYNKEQYLNCQKQQKQQQIINKNQISIQFVIKFRRFINNLQEISTRYKFFSKKKYIKNNNEISDQQLRVLHASEMEKQLQNMQKKFLMVQNNIKSYQKDYEKSLIDKDLQLKDAKHKLTASFEKINELQENISMLKLYYNQLQYKMISSSKKQPQQQKVSLSSSLTKDYLKSIIKINTKLLDGDENMDRQVQCNIEDQYDYAIKNQLQNHIHQYQEALQCIPMVIKDIIKKLNPNKDSNFQYQIDISKNIKNQIQQILCQFSKIIKTQVHTSPSLSFPPPPPHPIQQKQKLIKKQSRLSRKLSMGGFDQISRSLTPQQNQYYQLYLLQIQQLNKKLTQKTDKVLDLSQKMTSKNIQLKKQEQLNVFLQKHIQNLNLKIQQLNKSVQNNKREMINSQNDNKSRKSQDSYMQFQDKKQFNNLNSDKDRQINMLKERINEYQEQLIGYRLQKKKTNRKTVFLNH